MSSSGQTSSPTDQRGHHRHHAGHEPLVPARPDGFPLEFCRTRRFHGEARGKKKRLCGSHFGRAGQGKGVKR
jgi:hypothetical protein